MQTLFVALSAALSGVIVALHVLSVIFSDKRSVIINFVNIALHMALVAALLLADAALELLALAFMVSLLVYVLATFVRGRLVARSDRKEGGE